MQDQVIITLIRIDLLIEAIAGIIALMVAHYANKAFNLTREKKLSDLSTGFMVLSAGMFGRVFGTLYFLGNGSGSDRVLSIVIIAVGVMKIMAYAIFVTSTHRARRANQTPVVVAAMALPFLTSPELDVVAILLLIVVVLQTLMNYAAVRTKFALYVFVGFLLLLISHVLGMVDVADVRTYFIYLASQLTQFLGLFSFLVMLRKAQQDE